MKLVISSRVNFHDPNCHGYDGKPAKLALATTVRKIRELQPGVEPTRKWLWNRICAEKVSWCLRCYLY